MQRITRHRPKTPGIILKRIVQFSNPSKVMRLQRQDLCGALVARNDLVAHLLGEDFIPGENGPDGLEVFVQAGAKSRGLVRIEVINQLIDTAT
ncbi:hypothetical protein HG530_008547 [Fusarium avenaceum]|nr:hypothetical protein HG530_008547 [Fusarium avenaceum]